MRMKKTASALLAILLLTMCFAAAASAATMGVVRTLTKAGTVNLRAGGGTSYPAIGYVTHGDILQIHYQGNYWDRVTVKSGSNSGKTGWIYNKYVTNLRNIGDISEWGALAHIRTNYGGAVHLRKGPGTGYGIRETLPTNAMLIILDKYNSRWYEVQVVNSLRTGFVYRDYIANGVIGTTIANVNLRRRASSSASVLDVVPNGSKVTVLYVGKNWSKVRWDGMTGYVYNNYLKLF